mmetsp:Transcript_753/g.1696  ORF Transcript_753/g.1696 Transcript_753/m.1696 type:complete len:86 (+) Transcript_753:2550-2807(+)
MKLLKQLDEQVSYCDRQEVVPMSIIGLQVLGCVQIGLGNTVLCKCHVVERGCRLRDSDPSWFSIDLVNTWSGNGSSSSHNIWIKE